MDMKEKLVGLLQDSVYENVELDDGYVGYEVNNEQIADYLIAQGVMVQEWISVKDRLPEDGEHLLVCYSDGRVCDQYSPVDKGVTHWMPLPQPPKGE